MKRLYSIVHIAIVAGTLLFCSLKGQSGVEMIPYRLLPSHDVSCPIEIEIIKPVSFGSLSTFYSQEIADIIIDRIVFELTNQFAQNEVFSIDDKYYYLLRVPYTGVFWN